MGKINHYLDLGVLGEDVDCVVEYDYEPATRIIGIKYEENIDITGVVIDGVALNPKTLEMLIGELNDDDSLHNLISDKEASSGEPSDDYWEDK